MSYTATALSGQFAALRSGDPADSDDVLASLLAEIDRTEEELCIEMYAYTLVAATDHLLAVKRAGRAVSMVLDAGQVHPTVTAIGAAWPAEGEAPGPEAVADLTFAAGVTELSQVQRLQEGGVAVRMGKAQTGGIIHEKGVCRDRHLVGLGSYNWSLSAARQRNHWLWIDDTGLAQWWLGGFWADFNRLPAPAPTG